MRHPVVARTVLLRGKKSADAAVKALRDDLKRTGYLARFEEAQEFKPPCARRIERNYASCNRIYNRGMRQMLDLLVKPWRRPALPSRSP